MGLNCLNDIVMRFWAVQAHTSDPYTPWIAYDLVVRSLHITFHVNSSLFSLSPTCMFSIPHLRSECNVMGLEPYRNLVVKAYTYIVAWHVI